MVSKNEVHIDTLLNFVRVFYLLVAESFDWRGVDDSLFFFERKGDGVLGGNSLTGRRVSGHENRLRKI